MKSIEHETFTEYQWELGDLVRLKKGRNAGRWDEIREGEFGRVSNVKDSYFVQVSLHGFSRDADSIAALSLYNSRFDLVPWVRSPEDEPALARNVLKLTERLAWMTDVRCKPVGIADVEFHGTFISMMGGEAYVRSNPFVVADALAYFGDGNGSLDRPESLDWTLNAAGHEFLDKAESRLSMPLAGGGGIFDMSVRRDHSFHVRDLGTGRDHVFEGAEARRLYKANRSQVGMLTDGRMPTIMREALDFPRTLRIASNGLKVVETGPVAIEVHRGGEIIPVDGEGATLIRRACSRVVKLERWLADRPEYLEEPVPYVSPG